MEYKYFWRTTRIKNDEWKQVDKTTYDALFSGGKLKPNFRHLETKTEPNIEPVEPQEAEDELQEKTRKRNKTK